jgi:hypothetical protein
MFAVSGLHQKPRRAGGGVLKAFGRATCEGVPSWSGSPEGRPEPRIRPSGPPTTDGGRALPALSGGSREQSSSSSATACRVAPHAIVDPDRDVADAVLMIVPERADADLKAFKLRAKGIAAEVVTTAQELRNVTDTRSRVIQASEAASGPGGQRPAGVEPGVGRAQRWYRWLDPPSRDGSFR